MLRCLIPVDETKNVGMNETVKDGNLQEKGKQQIRKRIDIKLATAPDIDRICWN